MKRWRSIHLHGWPGRPSPHLAVHGDGRAVRPRPCCLSGEDSGNASNDSHKRRGVGRSIRSGRRREFGREGVSEKIIFLIAGSTKTHIFFYLRYALPNTFLFFYFLFLPKKMVKIYNQTPYISSFQKLIWIELYSNLVSIRTLNSKQTSKGWSFLWLVIRDSFGYLI